MSYRQPPDLLSKKVVVPACVVGALIIIGSISAIPGRATEPGRAIAAASDAATVPPASGAPSSAHTVVDVVDGDTVKLNDGRTVRIVGIDAPETVAPGRPVECWGPESATFARQALLDQAVTLVEEPTQDPLDKYGRTLAYLVLPDGRDFSVIAAEAGHARASLDDLPVGLHGAILAAESRARAAGLGLWGPACASAPPPPSQQPAAARQSAVTPTPAAAPPPAVPRPQPVSPPVAAPHPPAPPTGSPPQPQPPAEPDPEPDPSPVYYSNCSEARAAGAAPLYAGQPGYRSALDRDGDGVACES